MMERSKRFGLINQDEEDEKKKKRAERFHVAAGSNVETKIKKIINFFKFII